MANYNGVFKRVEKKYRLDERERSTVELAALERCAGIYMFKHDYTKNFVVTLALLPIIVQMVITLVNWDTSNVMKSHNAGRRKR